MKKSSIAFDTKKYLKIQKEEILKRISLFKGKLYVEFGGKLFDDNHAARVLPGFEPDAKLQLLLSLKDRAEIVIVINSRDINSNKVRNDTGITYEAEVERLIDNKITMSFEEYKAPEIEANEIGKDIVKKFIPFDSTGTEL